jgi:hypothetical protein
VQGEHESQKILDSVMYRLDLLLRCQALCEVNVDQRIAFLDDPRDEVAGEIDLHIESVVRQ